MTTQTKRGIKVNPRDIRKQIANQPTQAQNITGDVVPGYSPEPISYDDAPNEDTLDD